MDINTQKILSSRAWRQFVNGSLFRPFELDRRLFRSFAPYLTKTKPYDKRRELKDVFHVLSRSVGAPLVVSRRLTVVHPAVAAANPIFESSRDVPIWRRDSRRPPKGHYFAQREADGHVCYVGDWTRLLSHIAQCTDEVPWDELRRQQSERAPDAPGLKTINCYFPTPFAQQTISQFCSERWIDAQEMTQLVREQTKFRDVISRVNSQSVGGSDSLSPKEFVNQAVDHWLSDVKDVEDAQAVINSRAQMWYELAQLMRRNPGTMKKRKFAGIFDVFGTRGLPRRPPLDFLLEKEPDGSFTAIYFVGRQPEETLRKIHQFVYASYTSTGKTLPKLFNRTSLDRNLGWSWPLGIRRYKFY